MNGSVYFDTVKYAETTDSYGKLSGRVVEELISESRDNLKNQDEKKHPSDFALWIKADESHLMKWLKMVYRISGVALGVLCDEYQVFRVYIRHSWWRTRLEVSTP
jgi:hypothetical protein